MIDSNRGAFGERKILISRIGGWPNKRLYSIELTGTFVSNLESDGRRVYIAGEHSCSTRLQSNLLLV